VTVTVTNLKPTVSVDIKETGVRNIPGRTEPKQLDGRSIGCDPLKRRHTYRGHASFSDICGA
jgi:hypothetical protein